MPSPWERAVAAAREVLGGEAVIFDEDALADVMLRFAAAEGWLDANIMGDGRESRLICNTEIARGQIQRDCTWIKHRAAEREKAAEEGSDVA